MTDRHDIRTLEKAVHDFCMEREWDPYHNLKDLAIGVSTEAAELLELFRFKSQAEMDAMTMDPEARRAMGEELADVLIFTLRLADKAGIDMTQAFYQKLAKNAERYPVAKARGRNDKYSDL